MRHSRLISQEGIVSQKQLRKMYGQLKLSRFLQLNRKEFQDFIEEVESDPLFRRLMFPSGFKRHMARVISYDRFPHTSVSRSFLGLVEEVLKSRGRSDIESMILSGERVIRIIKSIGVDKFKRYFLLGSSGGSIGEIAARCGISTNSVRDIIAFVDKVFIKEKFFSHLQDSYYVHYQKVASVCRYKGKFTIEFFDLHMARGRYNINYDKLDVLKKSGGFEKEEIKAINRLISSLNLINLRKSLIFESIRLIIDKQKAFLKTQEPANLMPFTQKEAADELGISPSLLNRVIRYKSIEMPWGEEKPLSFFFPNIKTIRMHILALTIDRYSNIKSDAQAQDILKNKYGVYVSRRTIAKYRKELSIRSFGKRNES